MTASRPKLVTALILTAFVVLVVGGPYSFLITKACQPSGISDFVADVRAFHTREGC